MYKMKVEDRTVYPELGFNGDMVRLEIKCPVESQMLRGKSYPTHVELSEKVAKHLGKKFGTYGINWYFISKKCSINYFDGDEWRVTNLFDEV